MRLLTPRLLRKSRKMALFGFKLLYGWVAVIFLLSFLLHLTFLRKQIFLTQAAPQVGSAGDFSHISRTGGGKFLWNPTDMRYDNHKALSEKDPSASVGILTYDCGSEPRVFSHGTGLQLRL